MYANLHMGGAKIAPHSLMHVPTARSVIRGFYVLEHILNSDAVGRKHFILTSR